MTCQSPYVISLSAQDETTLRRRARAYTSSHAEVVRAKIVLLAAEGHRNVVIAERLDVHVDVVSRWRRRFHTEGLAGLRDRTRSGRPREFTPEVVSEVKAMACEPPAEREVPLSRWSSAELAAQAVAEGITSSVSSSTVRRWLREAAIKPWQHRSWIFPRDPDFAAKAARVLDLYQELWDGVALGDDEYVISADEKSQLQAVSRRHRDRPAGPGRTRGVEFEYRRHGTLAYLAANVTWPTAQLVHLPIHASWLNQIEIVFSIIQRKVIKPADFADLDALTARLTAFEPRYNATAAPFDWTFTRHDLDRLLDRIDTDQPHQGPARAA